MTPTQSRPARERLLTREEVAEVFNVSPRTVTEWARSGRFPSTRTPGGQYRFRESDVDAQLNTQNENGPVGAGTPQAL